MKITGEKEDFMANAAVSDLTLIHYSSLPVKNYRPTFQYLTPLHKPQGLWVSADGYGDTWRDYLLSVERDGDYPFAQKIELRRDAKILRLRNLREMEDFTTSFAPDSEYRHFGLIEWRRVADEFSGIVIAPWQPDFRFQGNGLHSRAWYWGWDCACGCIWGDDAVETVGEPERVSNSPMTAAAFAGKQGLRRDR